MTVGGESRRSQVAMFYGMDVWKTASELSRGGADVVSLAVGQPATPAPAPVLRAARAALSDTALAQDVLGYTESLGIPALRTAIAGHYHRWYQTPVDVDDVVITTGSSGGFALVFLAAFDVGDRVVMGRPGYPSYRNTLAAFGIVADEIYCGPQSRYQLTPELLDQYVADTGAPPAGVIVASPANPTGTIIEPAELAALCAWCDAHGSLLISDEIYHGIVFDGRAETAWTYSRNAIVMGSVSKYFSMTGWRLGWMLLPRHLNRAVERLTANLTICPPALAQVASIAAFADESYTELDRHVDRYRTNRDIMVERLAAMGITQFAPPDGAFYVYADISDRTTDTLEWSREVLADTGVAIVPGLDFDIVDGRNTVRLSYAGSTADIVTAMDRLAGYLR